MKVNAEKFLDNLNQYKLEKTVFFVTGNEEGLVNKIQNIILSKQKSNIYGEIKILDLKIDKNISLKELSHSQSFFNIVNLSIQTSA